MIITPSIDLDRGVAVKWVGGKPGTGLILGDPIELSERLRVAGFRKLHVVDLTGARIGRITGKALELSRRLSERGFTVRLGGGIRSLGEALAACNSGASEIVIGTLWVSNPQSAARIVKGVRDCRVIAAVDVGSDGFLRVSGWTARSCVSLVRALRVVKELGFDGILYTRIDREGRMVGVDPREVREALLLSKGLYFIYSGGVSSLRDLELLGTLGVDEIVLGMSLYTGSIPWEVATSYA